MACEIVAFKESVDLTAPHEEVGSSKLRYVCHIDVQKGRVVRNRDGLNRGCWGIGSARHR